MNKLEGQANRLESQEVEVTKYLQIQMQEFKIEHQWIADNRAYRFYFIANGKNQYTLQISEEVLADSDLEKLKPKLERKELASLFEENSTVVVALNRNGISFVK